MKFKKLVRDKIPDSIVRDGRIPVVHVADNKEYWKRLKEKLNEEVDEFVNDESPEEFADILEVLDAIADYKQFDRNKIQEIKRRKAQEKGVFKDRIILDEVH
ncbi:MAG: nucleoside triphosphate pyrophosphohydrolase [Patescibacteria group bacterium]